VVIPLLYVVAPPTNNPSQPCIAELPRLSRDLIWVCNFCMRLVDSSVGAFAITSLRALFAILGVHLLLLLHVHLPLPAFSIGESVSWCIIPAFPVRKLLAVRVVAIPALSSPSLKIVAQLTTYLIRLGDVRYRHCSCMTRDHRS
jgi:hypothetical protein